MDQQPTPATRAPTLFDLLARAWRRPAAVEAVAFNDDGSAAAFAATDGSLALAALADPEHPARRCRVTADAGRATIRPRREPVRPPVTLEDLGDPGAAVPLVPHRRSCFAVGGDGRPRSVTLRGQVVPFPARLDGTVAALAHHAGTGRTAAAAGGEVALFADDDPAAAPRRLEHPRPLAALAFSPDGRALAAAHAGGVALWRLDEPGAARRDLDFAGAASGVSWSPDGAWLACPLVEGGFRLVRLADGAEATVGGYPTPMRTVAWSGPARALATSGAFRAVAWSMDRPPLGGDVASGALRTGRPGLVVVEAMAAHPARDLLAVGYANGLLNVARLGHPDELVVRQDGDSAAHGGGASVRALAWSADGAHLALGDADGTAAVVTFPPHLFK